MRKLSVILAIVLALVLATTQVFALPAATADAKKPWASVHVGWVTDYQPGVSITIQNKDGALHTFDLTDPKILPPSRAGELAVGSRVTIIAMRDSTTHGWIAFGIVVHPAGTGGTPPATPTMVPTSTPTETPTPFPTPVTIP